MPVLTGCPSDWAGVRRGGSTVPFRHSIKRQYVHAALGAYPLNVNAPFILFWRESRKDARLLKIQLFVQARIGKRSRIMSITKKFDIWALYSDKLRLTVISLINNTKKSLELFQKLNTPPKQVQKKSMVGSVQKMLTTTYLGFLLASSTPVILQIFTLKINTTNTT